MIKAKKYNIKLLDELSTIVQEELKFKLLFTEKHFDEHYLEELKSIVYEKPSIYNNSTYLELKENFELKCFRLENPFNYVYIDGDKNLQLFNSEKLKTWALKDYGVKIEDPEDSKIKKTFIDIWLTDPKQKSFNKIVFDPTLTSINDYNYFNGFKYTEGEQAAIENPFLDLLKRVCNDKKTYEYFIDWIAHIIQKPYKKTNIAMILYSNVKGIGKNCIVDGICKLIKGYSGHGETIEDITKNFNSHLVNKLFIYGDEIKASSKCISDKLKQDQHKIWKRKGKMRLKLKIIQIGYLQPIIKMLLRLNKEIEDYFLLNVLMKSYQKNYLLNIISILRMKNK